MIDIDSSESIGAKFITRKRIVTLEKTVLRCGKNLAYIVTTQWKSSWERCPKGDAYIWCAPYMLYRGSASAAVVALSDEPHAKTSTAAE